MSAVGERAGQASAGISELETALGRTQSALEAVERVDLAAAEVKQRSGRFVKLLLIVTVIGIAVLVAKKLMGSSGAPGSTDPYGSDSTEP